MPWWAPVSKKWVSLRETLEINDVKHEAFAIAALARQEPGKLKTPAQFGLTEAT